LNQQYQKNTPRGCFFLYRKLRFHKENNIICPADLPYGQGDGLSENGRRRRTAKAVFLPFTDVKTPNKSILLQWERINYKI